MRYDIPETVWNSYEVWANNFEGDLEELIRIQYDNNPWKAQQAVPEYGIEIHMSETCFEFIDSDYDKAEWY